MISIMRCISENFMMEVELGLCVSHFKPFCTFGSLAIFKYVRSLVVVNLQVYLFQRGSCLLLIQRFGNGVDFVNHLNI